jgi:hypothetical protein
MKRLCIGGPLDGKLVDYDRSHIRAPVLKAKHWSTALSHVAGDGYGVAMDDSFEFATYRLERITQVDFTSDTPPSSDGRDIEYYLLDGLSEMDALIMLFQAYAKPQFEAQ